MVDQPRIVLARGWRGRSGGREELVRQTLPGLEPKHDSRRWLGGMGDAVGVESCQTKIRRTIDEASILGAQGDMSQEGKVRAAAVSKNSLGLTLGSGNCSEIISRGVEHHCATFG